MGGNSGKFKVPPGVDPTLRKANTHYGFRMQLYCKTGYFLTVRPDGKVMGVNEDMNPHAIMEFTSVRVAQVRIRAIKSNLYLAMDNKGNLYGEKDPFQEETVFVESLLGAYNTYLSRSNAHMGWYVAIKKNGKPKLGSKTKWGQKSIQFLPVRLEADR